MSFAVPQVTNPRGVQVEDTRICVVMVGLPARGKSLIAQKGTSKPRLTKSTMLSVSCSGKVPQMAFNIGQNFQRR